MFKKIKRNVTFIILLNNVGWAYLPNKKFKASYPPAFVTRYRSNDCDLTN